MLSVNAHTHLSTRTASTEPSFLSHMHKMGVLTAYAFSQYADNLVCMQSARAFTALAHTQNRCIYGIFYQSMFKQTLACVQSQQSLHCSNTCTKWAYIRHIPSVNVQKRLSMRAVSPELSLLSHLRKFGVHTAYFSDNTQTRLSMHAVLPEPSLLSHVHKMGVYMAYSISQCSYAPEHACCLARAFNAFAHAQNGRSYGIFFQSKLKRA